MKNDVLYEIWIVRIYNDVVRLNQNINNFLNIHQQNVEWFNSSNLCDIFKRHFYIFRDAKKTLRANQIDIEKISKVQFFYEFNQMSIHNHFNDISKLHR